METISDTTDWCHDCKKELPVEKVNYWHAYDHYAPQGDKPTKVCDCCWSAPKHKARMRKDAEACRRESGDEEDDY